MEERKFDGIEMIKVLGKNLVLALFISLIGMFILALILSKTGVSDSIMGKAIIGISAIAICFSGFLTSKKLEMKGILCGILQGVLYMFLKKININVGDTKIVIRILLIYLFLIKPKKIIFLCKHFFE